MTPCKPDRFERAAMKVCWFDIGGNSQVNIKQVIKLLRAEHRWMVRMVHKVKDWSEQELAESDDVIAAILDQLHRRRHG